MNILTERKQVLNWQHYRTLEIQQRVRHGVPRFELTAYHATLPQSIVVRSTELKTFADDLLANFFSAIKTKKTYWDANALDIPTDAPSTETDAPPADGDAPPDSA